MNNVYKLPDSYAKGTNSNNYKLLNLNEQAIADVKKDLGDILNALDLEQATGRTLELYGDMVGQKRGSLTDVQYRLMILTRIGINVVQGNHETIINCAKNIFKCEASDIAICDGDGVCEVMVKKFPLEVLVNAGFTSKQAIELLEMLLPVGVRIGATNFEGTFEFAENADEYDEKTGFGNIEQTIGGYLGLLYGADEVSAKLPI